MRTTSRPTKRIPKPSRTTYYVNRSKGVIVVQTEAMITITIGDQMMRIEKREALELTVALLKLAKRGSGTQDQDG